MSGWGRAGAQKVILPLEGRRETLPPTPHRPAPQRSLRRPLSRSVTSPKHETQRSWECCHPSAHWPSQCGVWPPTGHIPVVELTAPRGSLVATRSLEQTLWQEDI